MDYLKWSREYLDESERIRRRIAGLKEASVGADNETRENLLYRINLLYCKNTYFYLYLIMVCDESTIYQTLVKVIVL